MKKIVAFAAVIACASASYQLAQAEVVSRDIVATVQKTCLWSAKNAGAYNINLVDVNGNYTSQAVTVPIGTVGCNTQASVKISSVKGGLTTHTDTCGASSQECIHYTAAVRWGAVTWVGGVAPEIATTGVGDIADTSTAIPTVGNTPSGALDVLIDLPNDQEEPLVGGIYSDTISIEVTPNT